MSTTLERLRLAGEFTRAFVPAIAAAAKASGDRSIDYSDFLAEHVKRRADRPALIGESSSMSWRELDAVANRTARWAHHQGLRRGDVVGLLMENRPEYIATWLGLSRIGVVTALLNTNLTGDRLAHCLREAAARHLIVGEELVESAASAMPELEQKPEVLIAGSEGGAGGAHADVEAILPGATSFDEARDFHPDDAIPDALRKGRRGKDGLFFIYTSGTTGLPKAARVSHSKAITAGMGASKLEGLTADDRTYICLPLYHSAGGMMAVGAGLFAGGALVIARKFSAKRFWSDCSQKGVTSFQYIGELCRYLLNSPPHPDERSHKIRVIIGNGLRPEIWVPFQERFAIPRILEFYGATEGNMALFNVAGRVGAVGYLPALLRKAMGMRILRYDVDEDELVRDADGYCIESEVDEPGELVIKITKTSPFEGYTNDEASKKKVLSDGFATGESYFRTGDLLRLDEDGFFYFVDRIGDTFRWKGENVSTNEVAEVLSVVKGVEEANVYGVEVKGTDGRAGMAAIVTNDDFDMADLSRIVESELAFYARPIFVRLLPQMETTGTFKHRKVDLVKEGYDPVSIEDPIYFRDPEKACYVPLDSVAFDRIGRGEIRV